MTRLQNLFYKEAGGAQRPADLPHVVHTAEVELKGQLPLQPPALAREGSPA